MTNVILQSMMFELQNNVINQFQERTADAILSDQEGDCEVKLETSITLPRDLILQMQSDFEEVEEKFTVTREAI